MQEYKFIHVTDRAGEYIGRLLRFNTAKDVITVEMMLNKGSGKDAKWIPLPTTEVFACPVRNCKIEYFENFDELAEKYFVELL